MSDSKPDLTFNPEHLCREEIYIDQKVGTLRRLVPVKTDGSVDESRAESFIGQAQIMTPMGPMPISFEVEGDSLESALPNYADAAHAAIERTAKEIEEMRRQQASQIVVPGQEGGGKIQLP